MKTIKSTLPLSPSTIAEYCSHNVKGETIDVIFDISDCRMLNHHILNYLAHLKIPCTVIGFDTIFLYEYITTSNYLGNTNLAKHHANVLYYQKYGIPYFDDVLTEFNLESLDRMVKLSTDIIDSLPLFLLASCEKLEISENDIKHGKNYTGVNFAHLAEFTEFFVSYLADNIFVMSNQKYYSHFFDEYIYGGDKLIQSFIDNPDNLLLKISGFDNV